MYLRHGTHLTRVSPFVIAFGLLGSARAVGEGFPELAFTLMGSN
jgi:hypothetical protein